MSKFLEKVLGGERPSAEEWREHLIAAHKEAPGMSPVAFADCRDRDGRHSYQWLAAALTQSADSAEPGVIVDLACGDGFLIPFLQARRPHAKIIGIDMSEAELEKARARSLGGKVELRLAMAEATGLADSSVDAVMCHMAFMLMFPIAPVITEIRRLLREDGVFAAVVSDGERSDGLFVRVQKQVGAFLREHYPKMMKPPVGDPRVQTRAGLTELLSAFGHLEIEEAEFVAHLDPQGVWEHIRNMYLIGPLPPEPRKRLEQRLLAFLEEESRRTGQLALSFPVRRVWWRKG